LKKWNVGITGDKHVDSKRGTADHLH